MSAYSVRGDAAGEARRHLRTARAAEPGAEADERLAAPGDLDIALLFRQHHAELVRLALLLTGDRPTAEDVVQEVFAALHARRDRLRPTGDPRAYVRAAVLNRCRSVQRRSAVVRRFLHAQPPAGETAYSAEQEALRSEERRQVLTALAALPRRRREVLVLRYYLDLSEGQIAEVLQVSPGTVKSTAARGLAALARSLGEES